LASSQAATTIYDPALAESDPRFGVEGALAAFDAQFSTSVLWENNDRPQNSLIAITPPLFRQHLGSFQSQITKLNATGGRTTIGHNVDYEWNNTNDFSPTGIRAFNSDWNVNLEAEVRQPLLRGAGAHFNRIAGPNSIPGFYNGVMIARLRTDQALTDFEASVRNLANDVERAYWALHLRYQTLNALIEGRDFALEVWQKVDVIYRKRVRATGEQVARAKHEYFLFRSQVEAALSELYKAEANLRWVMGLAASDGRLIRPATPPTRAKIEFDWCDVSCEALARSVELRKQKWAIKQAELELKASKNFLLPRLDFVGRYRWTGMGDDLLNSSGNPDSPAPIEDPITGEILNAEEIFDARFDNAYTTLTDGDFQEWELALEFEMPFGFRRELAGVRNAQLNLARERAVLQDQELLVQHQLSDALRELDQHYTVAQSHFNRWVEAGREFETLQNTLERAPVDVTPELLDRLLNSLRRRSTANIDYHTSVVSHNLAVAQVHFRKGSLLEYNGVYLAEGPWPQKAYFDAHRLARQRDASLYFDYGFTRPKVLSRGPYAQHAGAEPMLFDEGMLQPEGMPTLAAPENENSPELIPTPEPEPAGHSSARPSGAKKIPTGQAGPKLSSAAGWRAGSPRQRSAPDLADLNLDILAGKQPKAQKIPAAAARSPAQQASYQEVAPEPRQTAPKKVADGWENSNGPTVRHPSPAGNSAGSTKPAASGWKSRR
jgi:hypothetical protein